MLPIEADGFLDGNGVVTVAVGLDHQLSHASRRHVHYVIEGQPPHPPRGQRELRGVLAALVHRHFGLGDHLHPTHFAVVVGLAVLHLGVPADVDSGLHQVPDLHGVGKGAVSDELGLGPLADLELRQDLLHALGRDDAEAEMGWRLQSRPRLDEQFDPHATVEFLRFDVYPRHLVGPQYPIAADNQGGNLG